ncbi:hypothetical protein, partial [Rhabdothermincola sp.]|uniref:hypothetical protein n=1 Tax=Rhabdothermincola sp. TaxID=2820405 RepID=UPI002FDFC040
MRRVALVSLIALAVWVGSVPTALALPPYADTSYQCEGIPSGGALLRQFADPTARTTWAHWGVSDFAYGGQLYGSSRVRVLYLDQGPGSAPVVDRPVPPRFTGKVVTCQVPFTAATAKVIFLSPAPPPLP